MASLHLTSDGCCFVCPSTARPLRRRRRRRRRTRAVQVLKVEPVSVRAHNVAPADHECTQENQSSVRYVINNIDFQSNGV